TNDGRAANGTRKWASMVVPASVLMGTSPAVGTASVRTVAAPRTAIRAAISAIATPVVMAGVTDADVDRRAVTAAAVIVPGVRRRVAVAAAVVAISGVIAAAIAATHIGIAGIDATREREGREDTDHFQGISHDDLPHGEN